jgi:voltage-gated sodium channel
VSTQPAAQSESAHVARIRGFIETEAFQRFIIGVIIINAVLLGFETSKSVMASYGGLLHALDTIALAIFVVEIALKLYVYRLAFFRSAWNIFDLLIVGISLVPAAEGLSVLRAMRILRALRLVSMVPSMRIVVQALLGAIPAMSSVITLSVLIFYVTAVMATKLFGERFDEFFGTLGKSFYTLFQIMTLESWSAGIVRPVMEVYPYAWAFFVPFILIATFAVLNLFIAIVVNSMTDANKAAEAAAPHPEAELAAEIKALRAEISGLRQAMAAAEPGNAAARPAAIVGS